MDLGNSISLLFCIPFLGMLLSIAVLVNDRFILRQPFQAEKCLHLA